MTDLDEVYSNRLFELAANIPRCERLPAPDATASARSKLCGSTVTVDLVMDGSKVADFGQSVRACLLGQASAAVMGREIVGSTAAEIRAAGAVMRRMLKEKGAPPTGRWGDLAALLPVRDYPQRQASTLLVFDAVEKALAEIEGARDASAAASRAL